MPSGTRKPGEFCWINMITPQPAQAREFYAKLLGWAYEEMPANMGSAVLVGGKHIGGLFDLNGPNTPPGTPPCLGVMVKVDNADATAAKATSLGGKSKPGFDIMDKGRMAECFDPNGAQFDLWQANTMAGTDVDSTLPGAPSWFESLTTDVARATKFYTELFGWTPEVMPMPHMEYTVFKLDGVPIAGMMAIQPQMGKMPPHWGVYFTVTDADKSASEAAKLGGKVCVPPTDIPNVGRFAGIISPQGIMFYVIKYTQPS
jgi:predicted enzyme related to lactoylglutathione lyase